MTIERTAVNPWPWSQQFGYSQGEPQHAGDLAAQITLSLDNLEAVLRAADMTLANLVRLTVFTLDVDQTFLHFGLLVGRLAAAGVSPTMTMLGVSRLALPALLIELEGTAVG